MRKYTHLELNKDMPSLAGYYTAQKEVRLKYDGREILYVAGQWTVEASCCAVGSRTYALVPGYIVKWQNEKNKAGLLVSEVEPISDDATRAKVSQIITEGEGVAQIEFW